MARSIMILVLGAVIAYGLTNITLNEFTSQGTQNSVDNYSYNRAHDIANSMVDVILMRIANDNNYRVNTSQTEDLFGGYVAYNTQDVFFEGDSLVKIITSANYNGVSKSVFAYSKIATSSNTPITFPTPVKAAITANCPVGISGQLYVDGRKHDITGTVIPNDGKLGIWTMGTFSVGGNNAKVGGTVSSVDYDPSNPANLITLATNQTWPDGIPNTPDKVMGGISAGFPEGTLKNAAISGVGGSQYVTDPNDLTFPLQGITYVELPSGDRWKQPKPRLDGEGVVIVHNSDGNAIIQNTDKDYDFTGLLIADDIIHIHSNITGAVFALTESPSQGNVIGNGKGEVLFSPEAVINTIPPIANSSQANYGFGKKRLAVKYWYE